MKKIHVRTSLEYDVIIGRGLLAGAGALAAEALGQEGAGGAGKAACKAAVIADGNVCRLYGAALGTSLTGAGFDVVSLSFQAGEGSKNLGEAGRILNFLSRNHFGRGDVVFALGGGVCGDMAGFAAAVYMRGIRYVQVPTTLLAAVDSSVGGKTAVDLPSGKNLAGAFHQPSLVICDVDTLATMQPSDLADGWAEVIKCGIIRAPSVFEVAAGGCAPDEEVIASCVDLKRSLVEQDEFDTGCRKLLNLGHSFGHAIEKCSGFTVSHGRAVAIGTVLVSRAAKAKGLLSGGDLAKIEDAFRSRGLPTECPAGLLRMQRAMLSDKKMNGGVLDLIVPRGIGRCEVVGVPAAELRGWLAAAGLR